MKIYMIRHGQTDWNLAGKIQGKTDVPLNEEGRAQARFLAEAMKSRPAAKVFTSPLKRARETAQAVAEALDGLPPVKMHCSLLAEQALKEALEDYFTKNNLPLPEGFSKPDVNHDEEEEEA